ncbi:hypothetical protein HAX54_015536 [Datura stramonium]|uniref:Uncharacterized protein n=1 Tax=Datura stramonium TaxID=4076 RepID=A0ABS8TSL5_DATST|nr:hypothetical protein [Datura stramonium]
MAVRGEAATSAAVGGGFSDCFAAVGRRLLEVTEEEIGGKKREQRRRHSRPASVRSDGGEDWWEEERREKGAQVGGWPEPGGAGGFLRAKEREKQRGEEDGEADWLRRSGCGSEEKNGGRWRLWVLPEMETDERRRRKGARWCCPFPRSSLLRLSACRLFTTHLFTSLSSISPSLKSSPCMGYILDEDRWVEKASFKPKAKISTVESSNNVSLDGSSNSILSSLLTEFKDVKETLGVVDGDLHKSNELLVILTSNVADMKNWLTLIQREGVKSFNKVLRKVDSAAARAEISENELAVAVKNSFSSHLPVSRNSITPFLSIINTLKYFLGCA